MNKNTIRGNRRGFKPIFYQFLLCTLVIGVGCQTARCQVPVEPHVPYIYEPLVKAQFLSALLDYRIENSHSIDDKKNIYKYFFPFFNPWEPSHQMTMKLKPIDSLWGITLENFCEVELKRPYEFLNYQTHKVEPFSFNDDFFPYCDRFLVRYTIEKGDYYPFEASLDFVSGNIRLSHSGWWLTPLLEKKEWDIIKNANTATLCLKFRLYAFNATEPRLDTLAAKNWKMPYWTYTIDKVDFVDGGPCEARVYKGRNGTYDNDLIELIYYTTKAPKDSIPILSNDKAVYKVRWPIVGGPRYEFFYPNCTVLSKEEKQQLIADGKFYPFFHKE